MKMTKASIDENIDEILKEENPTAEAVKSLIQVKDKKAGEPSEVELKTDLTDDEVKLHTVLSTMSSVLEMKEAKFKESCILSEVIEKKERKALSKDRKSREEIVMVARQPDITMPFGAEATKESFVKRFFTSRKKPDIQK